MKRFLRMILVFGLAILCVVVSASPTYANQIKAEDWSEDEYYYIAGRNNILFYDPHGANGNGNGCGSGSSSSRSGPIVITGSSAEEKIWNGLTSFMTEEQAAGVMGNMYSESHFNPAQHEIGMKDKYQPGFVLNSNPNVSYGLGLIQWSFDRRIQMYNYVVGADSSLQVYFDDYQTYSYTYLDGDFFISVAGEDVFDRMVSYELEFLNQELHAKASYAGIFNTTTVEEAADYFLENVEIPGDIEGTRPTRRQQAQKYYDMFANGGGGSGGGGSGGGGSSTCSTNSEEFSGCVQSYAWPEYKGMGFLERMPDYADAVTRRIAEGKYVGGTVGGVPGIDCGGFVTTVMQECGFDPNYNSTCGSNTAPQEYYVQSSGDWEALNPGGTPMDAADLQFGDVAFSGPGPNGCTVGGGHTWMWVGPDAGFAENVVSASFGGPSDARAPMAGKEGATYDNARWYRKVR